MNLVLADSSYWIAMRSFKDEHHQSACEITNSILRKRVILLATPFIFSEVQAFFCRKPAVSRMIIRDFWENPIVRIEQVSLDIQWNALEILKKNADKSYSFCDAVSFSLMIRLGILSVLTFDSHFQQFGCFSVIQDGFI